MGKVKLFESELSKGAVLIDDKRTRVVELSYMQSAISSNEDGPGYYSQLHRCTTDAGSIRIKGRAIVDLLFFWGLSTSIEKGWTTEEEIFDKLKDR